MDFSRYLKKISLRCWVGLTLAVLFVILFFGLRPKGYLFLNDVTWLTKQPGIRFNGYGIAYTEPIKKLSNAGNMNANGLSIEIALKPASFHEPGFNFLFAIHNGNDGKQLVIGQYGSWLIAMNGDDYDHRRRTKRIAVNLAEALPIPQFAAITTGKDGTHIYLNGRLIRTKRDLTLKIPEGENDRLLLGNSVYGRHHWKGDVMGLAVYRYPLSDQDVTTHFNLWLKDGNFLFAKKYKPDMLYVFDEKNGEKVMDRTGGNLDFHIPSKMKILEKKILSFSWRRSKFDVEFFEDVMINLMGFIPFGFFLNTMFVKAGEGSERRLQNTPLCPISVSGSNFNPRNTHCIPVVKIIAFLELEQKYLFFKCLFERHGILITIVLCFFVSLFIEVLQAWIPSRSSDVLDLVLNTFGGALGAFFVGVI